MLTYAGQVKLAVCGEVGNVQEEGRGGGRCGGGSVGVLYNDVRFFNEGAAACVQVRMLRTLLVLY